MAIVTAFTPINLDEEEVGSGVTTIFTSTHIQVVDGADITDYFGFGFSFDPNTGLPDGGTLTSINASTGGVLQFQITALNHSLVIFNGFLLNNDLFGALGFLFNGDDVMNGSSGDDVFDGFGGDDTLFGNDGDDVGRGGTGNDSLVGGAGNDTLIGGAGNDTLDGGDGDDTYQIDLSDTIVESASAGVDTVLADFTYILSANLENLTLLGGASINGTGNALDNILTGNSGSNILTGGAGNDTYVIDSSDVIVEAAAAGTDTVIVDFTYLLSSNLENLTLTGSANINGTGNNVANVLIGNSGDNLLDGGAGADTMSGGFGDDTYVVDDAGDTVVEIAFAGHDSVQSTVTWTLPDHIEQLSLSGSANIDATGNALNNILTGNSGNNILDGGGGDDTMSGGTGNDTFVVDSFFDFVNENLNEGTDSVFSSVNYWLGVNVENLTLTGTAEGGTGNELNNVITGNGGNNGLTGGLGADTLIGGLGDDFYWDFEAGDVVVESPGEGIDSIWTTLANLDLEAHPNIENAKSTYNSGSNLFGNSLNNILWGSVGGDWIEGRAGDDWLDGESGIDTIIGGSGDDTYVVWEAADVVVENPSEGTDLVRSYGSYALSANVENLTFIGYGVPVVLSGNELPNIITAHLIYGNNDTLDGGGGADTLIGGPGDDTYIVDDVGDLVDENADQGTDLVQSSVTYTLAGAIENLTLTGGANINGTGNALANTLTGNMKPNTLGGLDGADTLLGGGGSDTLEGGSGNDSLNGGAGNDSLDGGDGNDTMRGGVGDDTYIVAQAGDVVAEAFGEGIDTINTSITYKLPADVETLVLTGVANINGTGSGQANTIIGNSGDNTLNGGNDDDTLDGGAGNDSLLGSTGNDSLDGGVGDDTMKGGLGDDTFIVAQAGDVAVDGFNAGTDTVRSSITYKLLANMEMLVLTGVANLNGTGITGNTGDNTLNGLSGNDTLAGGDGNDTLLGANGGDSLVGGNGNDSLLGGNGNDRLDGGAGDDTMQGNTGNDTYIVAQAGDVVIEGFNAGADTVQSSITFNLPANVETLILTGASNIDGTGNAAANTITGNSGDNTLIGGNGDDTLNGGGGNDSLAGSGGNDSLDGGTGNDTLTTPSRTLALARAIGT